MIGLPSLHALDDAHGPRIWLATEATSSSQNGFAPAACGLDYTGTGFLTSYTYDPIGNLLSVMQTTGSNGFGTFGRRGFAYDLASRLTSSTNPETGTITYMYDTDSSCTSAPSYAGELISKTDARGRRTCMQYDARHRVIAKTYPSDSTPPVTYTYNQTSAYGHGLTNTVGRLSSESTGGTYPTGSVFSYDLMGHVIDNSQCTPLNCPTNTPYPVNYTYAVQGMATATDGNANKLNYGYNTVSQLTSVTSQSGVYPSTLLSNVVYNAFDSPTTSSIGTAPLTDTREYDVRGRVRSISVDNPNATQSTTTINVSGSEQSSGGPTASTGTVTIEGAEQSGNFCNDAGTQCHMIYDKGTVTITVNGSNYNASYQEGSTASSIATSLIEVLNASGVVTATASAGTVTITSVAKGPSADYSLSASAVSTYSGYPEYFGSFNPYPSGNSLTGGGNCSGTCDAGTISVKLNGTTVTAYYGKTDNANSVAASLMTALNTSSPDVSAQLTTSGTGVILTSMPSGTYADFSFTATTASSAGFSTPSFSMSPTSGTMAQGSGTEIYAAGVSYEPNGDVANSNDNVNGSWVYTYDDFNRLLTAVSDTGEGCSEKYDNLGNRIAQAAYQGSCFNGTFTGSGNPFQISGLVYDQAGNVTNDGTYVYTYDSEGRVSTASTENAALIATYIYDAEGRRARKILSSTTQDDIYDLSGHVVSYFTTVSGATTWTRGEAFAGGAHLATYTGGATEFAHADWLGTERVRSTVLGVVASGSQWTSLPFGEGSAVANPSTLHFTGKERDTESGNDYFDARYYSSAVGRFMSPDWSAKTEPVPYSRLGNPQTLNLFAYVQNNPLTQFDPDGHCPPTLTSALSDLKNYAKSAVNRGIAWVSQHTSSGQKEGSQILVGGSTKIGPANVSGGVGYGSGSHSYALSPVGAAGQAGGQLSAFHGEVKTSSSKTTFDAATASGEINGEAGLTGKGGGIAAGAEGHLDVMSASDQAQWGPFTLTVTGEVGLGAELGGSLTNSGASFKAGLTDGIGGDFALSVNWGGSGVTSSVKGTSEGEFTPKPFGPPPE